MIDKRNKRMENFFLHALLFFPAFNMKNTQDKKGLESPSPFILPFNNFLISNSVLLSI
ncbi:hypothetical protein JOC75_004251 [Metabacillus crassostreae]|nr:hypothetical protein [Metabacillus crassostreae]